MRTSLTSYMRITNRYKNKLSSRLECIRICKRRGRKSKSQIFGWSMHVFNGEYKFIRQTWYMV